MSGPQYKGEICHVHVMAQQEYFVQNNLILVGHVHAAAQAYDSAKFYQQFQIKKLKLLLKQLEEDFLKVQNLICKA